MFHAYWKFRVMSIPERHNHMESIDLEQKDLRPATRVAAEMANVGTSVSGYFAEERGQEAACSQALSPTEGPVFPQVASPRD